MANYWEVASSSWIGEKEELRSVVHLAEAAAARSAQAPRGN